jgi:cold shock CspA family protein
MERRLQTVFKDTDSSPFLAGLIRERVERLARFHSRLIGCRVVVEVPHRSPASGKIPLGITIEAELPGQPLLIAKDAEDRRATKGDGVAFVNRAFDAMQRQLQEVAAARAHGSQPAEGAADHGVVVRLFPDQGYGFIELRGAPELHFTRNAVVGGSFDDLAVGTLVQVTIAATEGPMGPQASAVQVQDGATSR